MRFVKFILFLDYSFISKSINNFLNNISILTFYIIPTRFNTQISKIEYDDVGPYHMPSELKKQQIGQKIT